MHNRLKSWLNGYVCVSIKGTFKERFINLCKTRNILINNIHYKDDSFRFYIVASDFKELRQVAKKTSTYPRIKKKYGLPFICFKYRKRKPFIFGVMFGIFIMYIASLFIWNISFEGQSRYTSTTLSQFLDNKGIDEGIRKKDVHCNEIEEIIRKRYPDIGWVSAQIKGTRLIISIKENVLIDNVSYTSHENIVSDCEGKIRYIFTRSGTALVKVDDIVKPGDVLVEASVNALDQNGQEVEVMSGSADADIYIDTSIEYKDSFCMDYVEKNYERYNIKVPSIVYNNTYFSLNIPIKSVDNCDIIVNDFEITLFRDFILPFRLQVEEFKRYSEEDKVYSEREASVIAKQRYDNYVNKLIGDGYVIKKSNVASKLLDNEYSSSGLIEVVKKVNTAAN